MRIRQYSGLYHQGVCVCSEFWSTTLTALLATSFPRLHRLIGPPGMVAALIMHGQESGAVADGSTLTPQKTSLSP